MIIKNIIDEDFANYHKCSMVVGFPHCTFKCEKEHGCAGMCQNAALASAKDIEIDVAELTLRYMGNPLSQAIVCAGLEPFDSFSDLLSLVATVRSIGCDDDIVIYTGYNKNEIISQISILSKWKNVIIKFGRFIPNQEKHLDGVLGVYLASDNQYAERIS